MKKDCLTFKTMPIPSADKRKSWFTGWVWGASNKTGSQLHKDKT